MTTRKKVLNDTSTNNQKTTGTKRYSSKTKKENSEEITNEVSVVEKIPEARLVVISEKYRILNDGIIRHYNDGTPSKILSGVISENELQGLDITYLVRVGAVESIGKTVDHVIE